jgi:hypothetical protein
MANDLKLEAKTTNTKSPTIYINYTLLQDHSLAFTALD